MGFGLCLLTSSFGYVFCGFSCPEITEKTDAQKHTSFLLFSNRPAGSCDPCSHGVAVVWLALCCQDAGAPAAALQVVDSPMERLAVAASRVHFCIGLLDSLATGSAVIVESRAYTDSIVTNPAP